MTKRGPGRPKGSKSAVMTASVLIKLSPELLAQSQAKAKRAGVTFSAYVRACLRGEA